MRFPARSFGAMRQVVRRALRALALVGAVALAAPNAAAVDKVWTGLVLATMEEPPKPPPAVLEPFAAELRAVFGYNTFYLVGEKTKKIGRGTEEWIVPSDEFFLKLQCTDRDDASYTLALELYVKKKLAVTSDVRLTRDSPLFIRGPQWGRGQLIYVLEIL